MTLNKCLSVLGTVLNGLLGPSCQKKTLLMFHTLRGVLDYWVFSNTAGWITSASSSSFLGEERRLSLASLEATVFALLALYKTSL